MPVAWFLHVRSCGSRECTMQMFRSGAVKLIVLHRLI